MVWCTAVNLDASVADWMQHLWETLLLTYLRKWFCQAGRQFRHCRDGLNAANLANGFCRTLSSWKHRPIPTPLDTCHASWVTVGSVNH